MKSVSNIADCRGKKVLIRVDYNVPLKGSKILDPRRIESSYKTIDIILKKGGTPVLVAHLGNGRPSLKPIANFLEKKYKKLVFIKTAIDDVKTEQKIISTPKGHVVLLENIRRDAREEKNDQVFARILASLGNFYVNDAFSVSHRNHASIVGLPKYLKSFAGFQMLSEIKALNLVVEAKKHPFVFILGGAKFGTKIPLIEKFLTSADNVIITGAILNDFYKEAGFEVGTSVVEGNFNKKIKKLLENPKLLLPTDVVVLRGRKRVGVSAHEVERGDKICDIGPMSIKFISEKISKAKLVVWNGPTGWYEGGFNEGTNALAKVLLKSKSRSVIGGGDTSAVISKMLSKNPKKQSSIFVSNGGGATLEYLAKGTLPGVQLL